MSLNARTPYMDKNFRTRELQPTVGFASRESAIAYLNAVLDDYRTQPSFNDAQIQSLLHLLVELELETVRQVGDSIDLRGVSMYQLALKQSLSDQKAALYNAQVIGSWERIKADFKQSGKLQIDLGEYTAEPILLSVLSEKPVTTWGIEPSDNVGICRCYDVKEEAYAKETWKEVNANPDSQISVGHLHAFMWNTEVYGKSPEVVYSSFKNWVESQLSAFEREHGSLTPQISFKASDVIKQTYGGNQFLVGWRVSIKSLMEQNDTQPTKQSVLNRLRSHLPTR